MNTIEYLTQLEELSQHYVKELDSFTLEQLQAQPSEQEWSLGQMYMHLIQTALRMQIRNIELCSSQDIAPGQQAGEKSEAGQAVFSSGAFPPIRIQVPPSPEYTPQQPESKEQIIQGLHAVQEKMRAIEPTLDAIDPQRTAAHPRLGALQAKEWFALVVMHYRHHLQQKDRLKAFLTAGV
ncbi:DinB family protein [Paenibacillus hexagrammi]|uniref:DinB family protein n=1 Tax=Paenibacillus hexagrammi TaxID=2908839 RepID=A0ABY3SGJ5_9BACL|nr:DinB family protein [Paenibacillus sp. YPD9-1]UJF32972.1 DinB family protein [Paenibacillus sp. YPD9-1]